MFDEWDEDHVWNEVAEEAWPGLEWDLAHLWLSLGLVRTWNSVLRWETVWSQAGWQDEDSWMWQSWSVMRSKGFVGSLSVITDGSTSVWENSSVADFALYGQLSQLVVDRTPDHWSVTSPCGLVGCASLRSCLGWKMLTVITKRVSKRNADTCRRFTLHLSANRAALAAGEKELTVNLWKGEPNIHSQPVFKYQDKCFQRIQTAMQSASL